MQRFVLFVLVTLVLAAASFADEAKPSIEAPQVIETDAFQNIVAKSGDLYISGQPSAEGLKWLKAQGVTTIVNVRTPHEMNDRDIVPYDEAELAKELGITYVNVPMGGKDHPYTPDALAQVAAALQAAETAGETAALHCTIGWRASHVWAAYLADYKGLTPNEAVSLARQVYLTEQPFEALLSGDIRYERGEAPE